MTPEEVAYVLYQEPVRIRLRLAAGETRYTAVMTRLRADQELADWMWYECPAYEGDLVAGAIVERYGGE